MRLLADENFPLQTIEALRHAGHDVTWVRTDHPGAKDSELLDLAESDPTVGMDQQWEGHATVVTEDLVLMVKSGRSETR